MLWIEITFIPVRVVALANNAGDLAVFVGSRKEVETRQEGRITRAHISQDHAAGLDTRIGGMPYPLVEAAPGRLTWLLQTATSAVEEPTMVEAAEPAVLEATVAQVGAPVRAMNPEESGLAVLVAEEHQILAEEPHGLGRSPNRQVFLEGYGLPVTSH